MDELAGTPEAQPVTPVAPEAPPVAPEAAEPTPVAEPKAPATPEEDAAAAEDKEWEDVAEELFPGVSKSKKEEKKGEPAQSEKKPEAAAANKTPDKAAQSDEASTEDDQPEFDSAAIDARLAARQTAREVEDVRADVRKRMFADSSLELKDADGDSITKVEDVMRLVDPRTGEPFTPEAAEAWLVGARQQLADRVQQMETQVSQIAEVNVGLKDEADMVNYRYGALLKELPEVRDRLWAQFEKTLTKDDKTGVITKSPVSLLEFYATALEPYAELGRQAEAQESDSAAAAATAAAEAAAKAEAEKKRQAARKDRSDIYAGGSADNQDPEDKEWAEAATAVFGPKQ